MAEERVPPDARRQKKTPKRGKGDGSIYQQKDGLWAASLTLPGLTETGKRRRKVVRAKTVTEVREKLKKLSRELEDMGDLQTRTMTVEQWFTYWLREIAVKRVAPNTYNSYALMAKNHIIPAMGPKLKIDKITPDAVRRVHASAYAVNESSTYALSSHRVMSTSFEAAVKEQRIMRNPTKLVDAPRVDIVALDVLDVEEAKTLLRKLLTTDSDSGALWAASLLTGMRKGEMIGLQWDRVGESLDLSWQLQRLLYHHGCNPPCRGKRGADCPKRHFVAPKDYEMVQLSGGLHLVRPKSRAGWRIVPLVEPLRSILKRHREVATVNPHNLVFARIDGHPRDPSQTTKEWNAILQETFPGRSVRLHDLRHAAVDLLYEAGIPEDLIIEIIGHSTRAMSRQYKSKGNHARLLSAMERMSELVSPADSSPPDMREISA